MPISIPSLRGHATEILHPLATEVDFRELADTLAQLNLYCGASIKPISAALHTLIAFDAVEDAVKPWLLVHECHKARLGDITVSTQQALMAIANELYGPERRDLVGNVQFQLQHRHALVIHAAAGLSLPDTQQRAAILRALHVALRTEQRDFLSTAKQADTSGMQRIAPLRKVYRLRAAPDIADELYARFASFLPALSSPKTWKLEGS
jgi:hypothetical protein